MKPSRQVIPAEVVVSLFALSYAWLGGIPWPEAASLFRFIARREGLVGNVAWALLLGGPALLLVSVSLREWYCWKRCRWTEAEHNLSALWRSRLVLTQLFSWLYMIHLAVVAERRLFLLTLHASIGAAVCGWSYWENRRVRREIRYSATAASATR